MINAPNQQKLTEKEEKVQLLIDGIIKKDPEDLKSFFELFSNDIYNFPIRYYNFSDDDAGDFYLYAFEHLKDGKKISSYKFKSKFTTWFFSVLRNLVIDFLRTRKNKLMISSLYKMDANGNLVDTMENIPDAHNMENPFAEDETLKEFKASLDSMKIYHRVLFKLAFIHYIDLNEEEFAWLCETNQMGKEKLIKILSGLKEVGFTKSSEVRNIEDKLTANFQAITMLEFRIRKFFGDHPSLPQDHKKWSETYEDPKIPQEVISLIQMLMKKKKKHSTLIKSQRKSLLATRIPYKEFAHLLGATDGVLSVQLLRIIEKLSQSLETQKTGKLL